MTAVVILWTADASMVATADADSVTITEQTPSGPRVVVIPAGSACMLAVEILRAYGGEVKS